MNVNKYVVTRDMKSDLLRLETDSVINCKRDFHTYKGIADFFRIDLKMNRLAEEYIYALSLDDSLKPKGLFELGHGTTKETDAGIKELGRFLLLSGAERFVVTHNHPGGTTDPSAADILLTYKFEKLAELLDIEFIQHFVVTKNGYNPLKDDDDDEDEE